MFSRDWWRIETTYGYVELELDEAGGELTDERELDEANRICFMLKRELKKLNPRVLRPMLELYAQFHPEQFPPGISLTNREIRDIEPFIPAMIDWLEDQVDAGYIRLYDEEIVMAKREKVEKRAYSPQPIVPEKLTFIGAKITDQDDAPVTGTRVQFKLPDGDVKIVRTDANGEAMVKGFSIDGDAEITLLDYFDAGDAEPVEQDVAEIAAAVDAPIAPQEPIVENKEFSVKVVDEAGKPIAKVPMVFSHDGTEETVATGSDGVAKYKAATDSVSVTFESAEALAELMKPIWTASRNLERKKWVMPADTTTAVTLYGGEVVKVTPDNATTASSSPKATIEAFFGVDPSAAKTGVTPDPLVTLTIQPLVIVVEMLGQHFDVEKCFLLPNALKSVRELVKLHKEYEQTDLLIVGHTDTSASDEHNLTLSLERTAAMRAYLTDDEKGWLPWYDDDKPVNKRWGTIEDAYMIETLLEGTANATTVLGYQQWHNASAPQKADYTKLKEDGKIGAVTRKQLVLDYMHREDTTVPDDTAIKVHGCGEYFPLDSTGEKLDAHAANGQHEQEDRRVEVFLFPKELGMLPPVPGDKATKGGKEYGEWRRRATEVELNLPPEGSTLLRLRLHGKDWQPEDRARSAGETSRTASIAYRYAYGSVQSPQTEAVNGWAEIVLPPACGGELLVEWGPPDATGTYPCHRELLVECGNGASRQDVHAQLCNLGYRFDVSADPEYDLAVQQFQMDYGIVDEKGLKGTDLPPKTRQRLGEIYASADATPIATDYSGPADDEWTSLLGPMTPDSDEDTLCPP